MDEYPCPHCGNDIVAGVPFCRHCGASDDSGWDDSEEGLAEGEFASEDEFDYDEFIANEFPDQSKRPVDWKKLVIWFLLIAFALSTVAAVL